MAAELKPYPAHRDSGVEWLGEVPAYWEVRRLRTIAEMRVSNVDKHSRDGERPILLCNYVDVYKTDRIRTGMPLMTATAASAEIERFRLRPGDVLITKDSEACNDIGVPALVEGASDNTICGYHLALLRPFSGCVSGGFLFRAVQSSAVAYQFHIHANGVTRYGLTHNAIKSVWVPLPPPPEQAAIVRCLDYADRRIRRYIRAKQELIALLEEQKQAIIHQAVTGQIDVRTGRPYPAYKSSGLDELGDVPEHWEVVALKRLLTQLIDCEHKTAPSVSAGDHYVVRTTAVRAGTIHWDGTYCTDGASYMEWTRRGVPQVGDVIFTREAPAGEACLVPGGRRVCLGQRTVLLRPRPTLYDPAFLVHMIYGGPPRIHVQAASQGSTVGHFNVDDIGRMPVLAPPLKEQGAIVQVLKGHTDGIDHARHVLEDEVRLLQEYRTHLIADVVTGKLDVRNAAAALPEVDPLAADEIRQGGKEADDARDSRREVVAAERNESGTPTRDAGGGGEFPEAGA